MFDLRRREFVTLLGGAAVAWPLTGRAQQPAIPVVGFLDPASSDGYAERPRGFRQGLKDTGYVERGRMSRSKTIGGCIKSIGCRRWRLNWFAAMSP